MIWWLQVLPGSKSPSQPKDIYHPLVTTWLRFDTQWNTSWSACFFVTVPKGQGPEWVKVQIEKWKGKRKHLSDLQMSRYRIVHHFYTPRTKCVCRQCQVTPPTRHVCLIPASLRWKNWNRSHLQKGKCNWERKKSHWKWNPVPLIRLFL